jgi:hypothetical protein
MKWPSISDEPSEPSLLLPQSDRAFCLSPPKMALAFGVLGLVFLCAVAVALYTLLRGHRRHYHNKAFLGEETLIVQDSPLMGHRIQWPHIRVMHWWCRGTKRWPRIDVTYWQNVLCAESVPMKSLFIGIWISCNFSSEGRVDWVLWIRLLHSVISSSATWIRPIGLFQFHHHQMTLFCLSCSW